MAKHEQFFLVWSPQGQTPPVVRHPTRAEAVIEAKRLAAQRPGAEFFVLASVGCAKRVDVAWIDHVDDTETEIPF